MELDGSQLRVLKEPPPKNYIWNTQKLCLHQNHLASTEGIDSPFSWFSHNQPPEPGNNCQNSYTDINSSLLSSLFYSNRPPVMWHLALEAVLKSHWCWDEVISD